MTAQDIMVIEGSRELLLIAPHGHQKDDENTAELTEIVAHHLNCQTIVNSIYRKPRDSDGPELGARRLNLNKSDHAGLHPWFLNAIRTTVDTPSRTLVIWVHGIKDENIRAEAKRTAGYSGDPNRLLVIAGHGQGKSPKTGLPHDRYTANPETVAQLVHLLTTNRLTAMAVRADAANYRGRHEDYMNQWFLQNDYPLTSVESIQLELKYTGVRDNASLGAASLAIANTLSALR